MATTMISPPRRKASKRPAAATEPTANGMMQASDLGTSAKKTKLMDTATSKIKVKKENDVVTVPRKVNDENHDKENQGAKQVLVFNWTPEELAQLITNLSACLPRNDNVKYTTLIDKLDWEKVRFGQYTAAQCKEKWMQIVTKLRRFRTLTDMVTDAKVWLKCPWSSYSSKKQKHPEMPKKPLTPYFRYFLEKREKYSKDNPEMSMTDLAKLLSKKFQQLPDKKKQKYKEAYEKENEIYKQELEKFKKCHPDQFPAPEMRHPTSSSEGPDKPHTAFNIFVSDRLKKPEFSQIDRREAMEKLRKQWSSLSDNKKVKWIRKALQDEQRYGMEVEKYRSEHPDFHPEPVKAVLSKAEKELKDRCDGKPERPPNSGYSLFSRIKLRELKDFPSKAKMGEISKMWKQLSDVDRDNFNKQAQLAIAKYKEDFAVYVSNLPQKEREKLESEMKTSNKKKVVNHVPAETISNDISELEAIDGGRPKKPLSAMFYFQQEKFAVTRQKNPDLSKQDVMKMLAKEYSELPEKKKEKYKKIAEEAKKAYDEVSVTKVSKPESGGKKKLFKGEPRRPPQSGYALFSSEKLSELTHVDPKHRMTEIAKMWKSMAAPEKEKYAKRVQELMRKYNKDMQKFLKGLTVAEFQEYDKYRKSMMKKKSKKGADGAQKNSKKDSETESSDEESSDDDDDSEKSDAEDSGSGSESGSGSSSGSDDSDSDSGSDDDEEDDDDDDDEDDDDDDEDDNDEKKAGYDNDSSSSDSDSDSGSGSYSGSGSDDSSDSGSDNEEEKSG